MSTLNNYLHQSFGLMGTPEYAAEGPVVGECRSLFSPDYAPEEIYEIAAQLMKKGGISPLQPGDGVHSRFQGSTPSSPGATMQEARKPTKTSKPKRQKS
ncbi:MAG: hypothetical protein NVSMB3_01610 [Acidobacteriaceae bacterium]